MDGHEKDVHDDAASAYKAVFQKERVQRPPGLKLPRRPNGQFAPRTKRGMLRDVAGRVARRAAALSLHEEHRLVLHGDLEVMRKLAYPVLIDIRAGLWGGHYSSGVSDPMRENVEIEISRREARRKHWQWVMGVATSVVAIAAAIVSFAR